MYLMQAPPHFEKDMKVFGHELINGICMVGKQYWWNFLKYEGFKDITPRNWPRAKDKPANMQRVLFHHRSGIGDSLFITAAIKAFHRKYPEVKIDISTSKGAAQILYGNPGVEETGGQYIPDSDSIGHYVDLYDDAINFDRMIAGNTESNIKNVYDIVEEWSGIEIPPEDRKPEIVLTVGERAKARKFLDCYSMGRKTVVIQYESSASVRSLSPKFLVKLAEELEHADFEVFLYGTKGYGNWTYFGCSHCDERFMSDIPQRIGIFEYKCPNCGHITSLHNDKGHCYLNFIEGKSIREIAAIIAEADYFIGPDSSGIHMAAAFDKPSLALFSSFDASLRCETYKNTAWIQKEYPCAPCFLHSQDCPNRAPGKSIPPCMEAFTVEEILDRFLELVKGNVQRDYLDIENSEWVTCPVCSGAGKYATRKGNVLYLKCSGCGTLFIDRKISQKPLLVNNETGRNVARMMDAHWKDRVKGKNILVVGRNLGITVLLDSLGWKPFWWDGYHSLELPNGEVFDIKDIAQEPYDAVLIVGGLEKTTNYDRFFRFIQKNTKDDAVICIVTPDASKWAGTNSNWTFFNGRVAGENQAILTKEALVHLLAERGLEPFGEESAPPVDCMMVYARKRGSSIE